MTRLVLSIPTGDCISAAAWCMFGPSPSGKHRAIMLAASAASTVLGCMVPCMSSLLSIVMPASDRND